MKTDLQTKFLQHLNNKKKDEGFTLIELLVVIIIIGILAAIALPSFLNQAAKAKQAEGKNNVGAVNRAQQAYHAENDRFAESLEDLEIGIPTDGNHYECLVIEIGECGDGIFCTYNTCEPKTGTVSLRAYTGKVQMIDGQSLAGACGTIEPSATAPTDINITTEGFTCPAGSEPVE